MPPIAPQAPPISEAPDKFHIRTNEENRHDEVSIKLR